MYNFPSLIGIVYFLLGLAYLAISIAQVMVIPRNSGVATKIATRIIQSLVGPFLLVLSGLILLIQGWRLDPVLQLQQVFNLILIVYLMIRDILRTRSN